ncbi:sensor histidine kinase [Rhizobium rosettiformans]|uniref:sensor histidine kinase n=1 Tax=Rhizobium rosettiformans TaxID=1368430 RepID=UPI0028576DC2|nr:ATP-binding protein [Rhizobium rosettiformans]MDR7031214.1 two-component system C4-dicarboxylate transport sensor histidine kinase DctB [Rhizobium rosettiformans]MDR7067080.1 two-component system C4-dicarboxylate transport sensor histidine kinase DctB [Rhizobium rosettiformans]
MTAVFNRVTLVILTIALVAPLAVYQLAGHLLLGEQEAQLQQNLSLTSRSIMAEIDRYRALPEILGEDARIRALASPPGPGEIAMANAYLESIVKRVGPSDLYVLNDEGITLAASNHATPQSFVGHDYSFRPYFLDAMRKGEGRFYAIGVTTKKPGYFLSSRIDIEGRPPLVVVVKADLSPLEAAWNAAGVKTAIADKAGLVFLAGDPRWRYRPLQPIDQPMLDRLRDERTYDGVNLDRAQPIFKPSRTKTSADTDEALIRFDGSQRLITRTAALEPDGWTVIAATDSRQATNSALLWALAALAVGLMSGAGVHVINQRRQLIAMRLRQSVLLEQMVAERTRDLAAEVDIRKRTEEELRQTQEGLIHAEKMAALGRMSAAIVHEVSQPLAALDSTLATAGVFANRDEQTEVGDRLEKARGLIRRMQRTVKHLKTFSRRDASDLECVSVDAVIANVVELAAPRSKSLGLKVQIVEGGPSPTVIAVATRLEQAMLNLLLNAIDAVQDRRDPEVKIEQTNDTGRVEISIVDNGPGIAPQLRERVWEPFFTTKLTGEGLGLGLSIAATIIRECGGDIAFSAVEGGGTRATIGLPIAADAQRPLEAAQ